MTINLLQYWIQDFRGGGAEFGAENYIGKLFAKNYMEMKEIRSEKGMGHAAPVPLPDLPMYCDAQQLVFAHCW